MLKKLEAIAIMKSNTFKVIIAGSRTFSSLPALIKYCDHILSNQDNIEIVSGGAKGADKLGEEYAKLRGYSLKIFPANWNKYGKSAGYKRNVQMADYADALIAIWDGQSKGTGHMIDLSRTKGLKVKNSSFHFKIKTISSIYFNFHTMKLSPFYCYNPDYVTTIDLLHDNNFNVLVRLIDYRQKYRRELLFNDKEEIEKSELNKNTKKLLLLAMNKAKLFESIEQISYYNENENTVLNYLKEHRGMQSITKVKKELGISFTKLQKVIQVLYKHNRIHHSFEYIWYNETRKPFSHK